MKKIDIIIFSGQSNMQGQSERLSETEIVENAFEYRFLSDSMIPLKNPVGECIKKDKTEGYILEKLTAECLNKWLSDHITGAATGGNTNLVPAFCRAYIKETNNTVLAVHIAKGSTTISEWLPHTDGYNFLVEKSLCGIKAVKENYQIGNILFVWLQGESDAVCGKSKAYYKEKLTELNTALKEDIAIEKFGIIRVGRFTNDSRDDEIILAQDEVCQENEDFLMLTDIAAIICTNPKYMNPSVSGHYSAEGLELLGTAAGKTLGESMKIKL